ncbi:MAG: HNH endonuclease signature motif containing protein [Acidimicrobiia bacterium]
MARGEASRNDRDEARRNSQRRRNQRAFWKRRDDDGFLVGGFALPMEHGGAIVESFFDLVTNRMRPKTGEAWEPLERRQADVLIGLCQLEHDEHAEASARDEEDSASAPTAGARVDLHVDIGLDGEATLCGVPLPDEWVDAARANARVHLRVVDDDGNVVHEERARSFVSQKRRRAVIRRDGHCRWPGCHRRLRLQVHHLHPSSWHGPDDMTNLAAVCPYHHGLLIPHGDYVLEGNPNTPDGLTLRTVTKEERQRRRIEEAA